MKTIKYIVVITVAVLMATTGYSQATLQVTVQNIKESKGKIRVGLFASEEKFLKDVVDGKIVSASASEVTVLFENLKSGTYAVSVIHDANDNGELDTNMVGIPNEGFAFGNNAMGMFGPPSFKEAQVVLKDKTKSEQLIRLKYF